MKRVQRYKTGCVRFDRRRGTWNYLYYDNGVRRSRLIGTKRDYPTKASAWKAAEHWNESDLLKEPVHPAPVVKNSVEKYQAEKMPTRYSTQRGCSMWLKNHILPTWGDKLITELQPRPVELWLSSLELSPKSRGHVRGMMRVLWDYAMWSGAVPVQVNPISLVTVKDSSKRTRQPRSLTVDEFRSFIAHLNEPFRTIALVCVCFGLRISECLALKWLDIDWLDAKLSIQRGIVRNRVGEVKTVYSNRKMSVDAEMLGILKSWKQTTQFSAPEDWLFASPSKAGCLPWSFDQVWRSFRKAGRDAGIGWVGTHSMRHTYRSWLDAVGTPIAVPKADAPC